MIIEIVKGESMIIQYVTIASGVFAGIALFFNYFAFRKQQRNSNAILLSEFTSRYFSLIDQKKEYASGEKIGRFNIMFLNHLEWLAYMINHGYLPLDIAEIYQGVIINWYEKVRIGQEEVLSGYFEDQPNKFKDLDILYKKLKNKAFN